MLNLTPYDLKNRVKTIFNIMIHQQGLYQDLENALEDELEAKIVYKTKANSIRIKPDIIQDEMGLNKPATEKQTQSYIDNKLEKEYTDYETCKNTVKTIEHKIKLTETTLISLMQIKEIE